MSALRINWWTRFTDTIWFCWHYWRLEWAYRDAVHGMAAMFAGEKLPPENGMHEYKTWIEPTGCYCSFSQIVDENGNRLEVATENGTTAGGGVTQKFTFNPPSLP